MRTCKMNMDLIRITICLFFSISLLDNVYAQNEKIENQEKALELIETAKKEYAKINDYEAIIISSERINDKQQATELIKTYYLKPGNVYLKWMNGSCKGMQASYLPSRDEKDCFMSKETGLKGIIGTRTWCNDDFFVKNLYPHHFKIQEASIGDIFRNIQIVIDRGLKQNKISIVEFKNVVDKLTKQNATSVLVKLSDNPKDGLMWSKVHLFFDQKSKLPLHFITYDFSGNKLGEYAFVKVKKNIGLTIDDFKIE